VKTRFSMCVCAIAMCAAVLTVSGAQAATSQTIGAGSLINFAGGRATVLVTRSTVILAGNQWSIGCYAKVATAQGNQVAIRAKNGSSFLYVVLDDHTIGTDYGLFLTETSLFSGPHCGVLIPFPESFWKSYPVKNGTFATI